MPRIGNWILLGSIGTLAATLVFARLRTLTAAPEKPMQAVESTTGRARSTPSATNVVRAETSTDRAPNARAVAAGNPSNSEELETEPSPQDYIDRARAEPRDDAWAGPTEQLFEEDLRAKAQQHGFRVGNVECYTNTCEAELFWSSLADARADFKNVLAEPERSRCLPRLILTEGAHEDAPEMGVMLLHCKSQRQRAARQAGVTPIEDEEQM
jgi:hypothetical protein